MERGVMLIGSSGLAGRKKKPSPRKKCGLLQVIPGNDQEQPEIEHQTEILRNSRNNGIKVFQIGNKKHDEPYDE